MPVFGVSELKIGRGSLITLHCSRPNIVLAMNEQPHIVVAIKYAIFSRRYSIFKVRL